MKSVIGTCDKFGQKRFDRTFDKCMYCGHPIPGDLRLSDEEKNRLLEEKRKRFEENEAARRKETRKNDDRGSLISGSWWDEFGSGGGDFGDGGCGD